MGQFFMFHFKMQPNYFYLYFRHECSPYCILWDGMVREVRPKNFITKSMATVKCVKIYSTKQFLS